MQQHEERADAFPNHRSEGTLKLGGTLHLRDVQFHGQHLSGDLGRPQIRGRAFIRIQEDAHAGNRGDGLLNQFQQFPHDFLPDTERRPRDVAARPREAGDKPLPNRVGDINHDRGDRAGRLFGCTGSMRARGDEEVRLATHDLRRQGGESLDLPRRPPVLNDEILALDPAVLAQPMPKCLPIPRDLRGGGRGVRENTDPHDLPHLLRVGHGRRDTITECKRDNEYRGCLDRQPANENPNLPHGIASSAHTGLDCCIAGPQARGVP